MRCSWIRRLPLSANVPDINSTYHLDCLSTFALTFASENGFKRCTEEEEEKQEEELGGMKRTEEGDNKDPRIYRMMDDERSVGRPRPARIQNYGGFFDSCDKNSPDSSAIWPPPMD